jgi:hypothetical protein
MSDLNTPHFSYKQYLKDLQTIKPHGHVSTDIQQQSPRSAGSRGLKQTHQFIKEPVHMMGESLVVRRQAFVDLLGKKLSEPQSGFGKKEHDPRLLAKVWKMITGEEVSYNPDKDMFVVKKRSMESVFESWLSKRIPEQYHSMARKWFESRYKKAKK